MKANELMIGDWVRAKTVDYVDGVIKYVEENKRATTAMIHQLYNQETGVLKDSLYSIQVEPIALKDDEEFWGRNGYILQDDGSYTHFDDYYSINAKEITDSIWQIVIEFCELHNETAQCTVSHVHQLQHFYKLCGIDEEIIL